MAEYAWADALADRRRAGTLAHDVPVRRGAGLRFRRAHVDHPRTRTTGKTRARAGIRYGVQLCARALARLRRLFPRLVLHFCDQPASAVEYPLIPATTERHPL